MEKERIILNFDGHCELTAEDVVVEKIGDDHKMQRVDVSDWSLEEIQEGIDQGKFYINFAKTYANTLDGSIDMELELED